MEGVKIRKKGEEEEKNKEEEEDYPWKKFTHEELEKQYSPSRWSKRYNETEIIVNHVKESTKRSEEARKTVSVRQNILYGAPGSRPRALLDVYGEDLPKNAPLLVYVHGGYWQELNKGVSAYLVPPLFRSGVVVVVIGYDLAPNVGVADIVEEVRAGIVWSCELARSRGSKGVVLSGWSAGGQLVTEVMSLPEEQGYRGHKQLTLYRDLIRGIVTLSGVFDLRPLVGTYVNDPLHLTPELAWSLSPLRKVENLSKFWKGQNLKILVVVGEDDPPEFKRQSRQYSEECHKVGILSEFLVIERADHFSLVCDLFLDQFPLTARLLTFVDSCCGRKKQEEKEEVETEG